MNRLIMFCGKDINGKWRFGDLIHYRSCITISETKAGICGNYEVIPESVGQFTGYTDTDGKEIYEGDIIKTPIGIFLVEAHHAAFWSGSYLLVEVVEQYETEIIGNAFDNPELLKGGTDNAKS